MEKILESSYQKYTKDIIAVGLANVLSALTGILFLPLVTKILGVSDYGIWVQSQTITSLIVSFVALGLPYAMNRFLAAEMDKKVIKEDFWSVTLFVLPITLAISLIILVMSSQIANLFFGGATKIVMASSLLILVSTLNYVFLSFFRTFRQMMKYAVFTTVSVYAQVGIIIYLILKGYGVFSMVIATIIVNAALLGVLFFLIVHQIGMVRPRFSRIKAYLRFGLPTVPGYIASWVIDSSDKFFIGHFLGVTSVGIFAAADSLGSIPIMIGTILSLVLPPTLSKLYDEKKMQELKTHLSYSLKYSLVLMIPFVFGSAVLAAPILKLFSTTATAFYGRAVLIFTSINSLIFVTGVILNQILMPVKKTKIGGTSWTIAAFVNLGLNMILVPVLGIIGTVVSTLIAYLISLSIQLYFSLKEITFKIDWPSIAKCFIASIIMSLCLWKINPDNSIHTILAVVLGVIIYGLMIIFLKVFRKEELDFFKRQLFQLFGK